MALKVYKYGEAVLRERAQPVAIVTDELRNLAEEMIDTMHKARGVGLAAQQVGRLEKMCVIDIPEGCEEPEDELFNAPVAMPLQSRDYRAGGVAARQGGMSQLPWHRRIDHPRPAGHLPVS